MKTTLIFGIIFCFITCLGCSKDSDIPCGKITNTSWSISGYTYEIIYHLAVELSDGSRRIVTVYNDSFEVGDEYCNATLLDN